MPKRKASPKYKPYWHYVIMHLNAQAKGHSSPLERLCLRHGFKLVPVSNPHEHGVDLNPNLKEKPEVTEAPYAGGVAFERGREVGYRNGQVDTWERAMIVVVRNR